jgi:RHS repeat-associated protein
VLVRTRSEFACTQYCLNTLRRIVWDGDQVLYEISAPGGSSATAAQMEADTGLAVPFFLNTQHTAVAGFFPYGRVMYEHGGGIDAPLGVVRMDYSDELRDPQVIAPHATWRGSYDRGTPIPGQCLVYSSNGKMLAPPPDSTPASGDQYGGVAGGGTYSGTAEHCVEVDWPAAYTWSARQYRRGYAGPSSWMGSLIFESRDASGLYYRRNRYYDSEKGRFTQEDPIGLAGGNNVYGFGNGDPVTYSDPYGLAADGCDPPGSCIALRALQGAALGFAAGGTAALACTAATGGGCALGPAQITVASTTQYGLLSGAAFGAGEEIAESRMFRKFIAVAIDVLGSLLGGGDGPPPDPDGDEPKPGPPILPYADHSTPPPPPVRPPALRPTVVPARQSQPSAKRNSHPG